MGDCDKNSTGMAAAASCCGNADEAMRANREDVRGHYAETAKSVGGGGCCSNAGIYDPSELGTLPLDAVLASRGCGNPHAYAALSEGETVLDLGCGGGIDCLIAAREVGEKGRVIGLDMTDEMLELAERNRAQSGLGNVEFVKGFLEEVPLPDGSVDAVISNCVINLCLDKAAVLREAARVLAPGGRLVVADILVIGEPDDDTAARMRRFLGAGPGVIAASPYEEALRTAGFSEVSIEVTSVYDRDFLEKRAARKHYEDQLAEMDVDKAAGTFGSAIVIARK